MDGAVAKNAFRALKILCGLWRRSRICGLCFRVTRTSSLRHIALIGDTSFERALATKTQP
jgi:hypothetical protein